MAVDVKGIAKEVEAASAFVKPFFDEIGKVIVAQNDLVERIRRRTPCDQERGLAADAAENQERT